MSQSSPIGKKGDLRIAWESKITGYKGHGEWFDPSQRKALEDLVKDVDRKYPELRHWVETKQGPK